MTKVMPSLYGWWPLWQTPRPERSYSHWHERTHSLVECAIGLKAGWMWPYTFWRSCNASAYIYCLYINFLTIPWGHLQHLAISSASDTCPYILPMLITKSNCPHASNSRSSGIRRMFGLVWFGACKVDFSYFFKNRKYKRHLRECCCIRSIV